MAAQLVRVVNFLHESFDSSAFTEIISNLWVNCSCMEAQLGII